MVVLTFGRKVLWKCDGIAADFCPLCRRASVVDVFQLHAQNHIADVGLGMRDLVGHACRCKTCNSQWAMRPQSIQQAVDSAPGMSIEALIKETFPTFPTFFAERLEQESVLARDPFALSDQVRHQFIAEPFLILNNDVLEQVNRPYTLENILSKLGILGAICLLLTSMVPFTSGDRSWGYVLVGLALVLYGGVLYASGTAASRFVRRAVYPRLIRCLAPLKPTTDELTQVVSQLNARWPKEIKWPILLQAMSEAHSQSHGR